MSRSSSDAERESVIKELKRLCPVIDEDTIHHTTLKQLKIMVEKVKKQQEAELRVRKPPSHDRKLHTTLTPAEAWYAKNVESSSSPHSREPLEETAPVVVEPPQQIVMDPSNQARKLISEVINMYQQYGQHDPATMRSLSTLLRDPNLFTLPELALILQTQVKDLLQSISRRSEARAEILKTLVHDGEVAKYFQQSEHKFHSQLDSFQSRIMSQIVSLADSAKESTD